MKTLVTAALLAALALTLTGSAKGDEPTGPSATPVKKPTEVKRLTVAELGQMLEDMGYDITPAKTKDGVVVGYHLKTEHAGITVYGTVWLDTNANAIHLYGTIESKADAGTPAEALLAMLALNNDIAPAAVSYLPDGKKFQVKVVLQNANVTPAALRIAVTQFAHGVKQALNTWGKVKVVAAPTQPTIER